MRTHQILQNQALIKSKDINEKNSENKLKQNINKELAEKYANKFDIGKVRHINISYRKKENSDIFL